MLRAVLEITSICLTLESAFFLLKNTLIPPSTLMVSCYKQDKKNNDILLTEISKQSGNTRVGIMLLLVSFTLQLRNIYDYPTVSEMGNPPISALYIAIVLSLLVFVMCFFIAKIQVVSQPF